MLKILVGMSIAAITSSAVAEPLRPDQQVFRAISQELVEASTMVTTGTDAAMRMANQLRRAAFPRPSCSRTSRWSRPSDRTGHATRSS
jgi:hypothetical protein